MPRLAQEWIDWLVENALRGASPDDLVLGLISGGLDAEIAREEVIAVWSSPILHGARRLLARSAGVEQVARLARTLDSEPVRELAAGELDEEELFWAHWSTLRPVILRGAAERWPARAWTFESLAERLGDVEIAALSGRSRERRWWRDRAGITVRMPLRELARLAAATEGDDVYVDGRADLLDQPGLEALRSEIGLLPGLTDDGFPKAWLGPRGTLTPLHHDQSTGWLVQLCGHKRLWLASPWEPALMQRSDGLYSTVDPRLPQEGELAEVRWRQVEIGPGDAILLPVGTWHQVEALTPSISLSMGGFRWKNAFPWYTPGRRPGP